MYRVQEENGEGGGCGVKRRNDSEKEPVVS